MGSAPPTIVLGLMADPARGFKDTAANILATGEFVVNLIARSLGATDEHNRCGCTNRGE